MVTTPCLIFELRREKRNRHIGRVYDAERDARHRADKKSFCLFAPPSIGRATQTNGNNDGNKSSTAATNCLGRMHAREIKKKFAVAVTTYRSQEFLFDSLLLQTFGLWFSVLSDRFPKFCCRACIRLHHLRRGWTQKSCPQGSVYKRSPYFTVKNGSGEVLIFLLSSAATKRLEISRTGSTIHQIPPFFVPHNNRSLPQ